MDCEDMDCEDIDIDSICNKLEAVKTCEHINLKLICDLNIIIYEIAKCQTFNINIYDVCVECGNSLVYDQEYQITEEDIAWLKKEGKTHFFEKLHSYLPIDNSEKYNDVNFIYSQLLNLFSLQVI